MNSLITVIANPVRAFCIIKEEKRFPTVCFIALLVLTLINMILDVPIHTKIGMATLSNMEGIPEAQADTAMQMIYKMRYISMVGAFIMFVIGLFINMLALFAISYVVKMRLAFEKVMNLIIICSIVIAIGNLVNTALLYIGGIETINSPFDIHKIGINTLVAAARQDMTLYTILSNLNPFQFWYVALIICGLKVISNQSLTKSFIVGIVYWLLIVIVPTVMAYISQTVMQSKGISL